MGMVAAGLSLSLVVAWAGGFPACTEDGVNLPANYNTLKFRDIAIDSNKSLDLEGIGLVRAMNGIHGSTVPVVPGDNGDALRVLYWGRTAGSEDHDGAHVTLVRLGTGTSCDVSLEGIYPSKSLPVDDPASYEFDALVEHGEAIQDLNTAEIFWQAALRPDEGGGCATDDDGWQHRMPLTTQAAATQLAKVSFNTLRHLRSDGVSGGFGADSVKLGKLRFAEFLDDPVARMNYETSTDYGLLFEAYKTFANLVKAEWPGTAKDERPIVAVGGLSFTFYSPDELNYDTIGSAHPLLRFIDFCSTYGIPLDFVSFKTRTVHPYQARQIAEKIQVFLDPRFPQAELIVAGMDVDMSQVEAANHVMLTDPLLESAYLGAFQSAIRIYLQDLRVTHAVAGRGPRVVKDLGPHVGETLEDVIGQVVPSTYFLYRAGADAYTLGLFDLLDQDLEPGEAAESIAPAPAFTAFYPFRQVRGHQRVQVSLGQDSQGMAVLASHDKSSGNVLHVIVANANVLSGNANLTYDLRLEDFVPKTVSQVEYKFAVIDQGSVGYNSFHFSATGVAETTEGSGTVSFVREMAIPSVHYIQFVKPDF